jgi:hypothetical protein
VIEMAEGSPPNSDVNSFALLLKRLTTQPPPTFSNPNEWSPAIKQFVARCLTVDIDKRVNGVELVMV